MRARIDLIDGERDREQADAAQAERHRGEHGERRGKNMQDEQLPPRRGSFDERPAGVAWMVHLVYLLVGEIVQRSRGDVAGRERDRGEEVTSAELEPTFARRA